MIPLGECVMRRLISVVAAAGLGLGILFGTAGVAAAQDSVSGQQCVDGGGVSVDLICIGGSFNGVSVLSENQVLNETQVLNENQVLTDVVDVEDVNPLD